MDETTESKDLISRRQALSLGAMGALAAGFAPAFTLAEGSKNRSLSSRAVIESIDKALAALDQDELVKLAVEMTDIPNPLGQEEPLARFFHQRMREAGLSSRLQSFAPERSNVLGIHKGTGGGRSLMFTGHLESGPATGQPHPKTLVDEESISGGGIWNMKGALAAYFAAVMAVRKAGLDLSGDVLIAGVAGAHDQTRVDSRIKGDGIQGYSIGTVNLLAQGVAADVSVVGEPTSFKLVRQHFGVTAVRIDLSVSRPSRKLDDLTAGDWWPESDAVGFAAAVIYALRAWAPDYKRRNKIEDVAPWVHISAVEGGGPWSPYPAMTASLYVFAGMRPSADPQAVLDEINAVLAKTKKEHAELQTDAQIYFTEPGPFVPQDHILVTGLQASHAKIFGKPPVAAVVPWHSDASPLMRSGIAAVNYGPPGEFSERGESVRIRDLIDCARVYTDLIVRICAA